MVKAWSLYIATTTSCLVSCLSLRRVALRVGLPFGDLSAIGIAVLLLAVAVRFDGQTWASGDHCVRELETSAIPHHIALQLLPRLQPLAKSLGERSAVVCLLYCVLVSPCSLVSLGVVGFPPVTTPPSTRSASGVRV